MKKNKQNKPLYQYRLPCKDKKCLRGEPIYYEELKKSLNLTLTPTAIEKLNNLAMEQGISRSEVVERWLRSQTESLNS
jgi:hypothetical protein